MIKTFEEAGYIGIVSFMEFSKDGRYFAYTPYKRCKILNSKNGSFNLVHEIKYHTNIINSLAFS